MDVKLILTESEAEVVRLAINASIEKTAKAISADIALGPVQQSRRHELRDITVAGFKLVGAIFDAEVLKERLESDEPYTESEKAAHIEYVNNL